jgi:hypothetical protein
MQQGVHRRPLEFFWKMQNMPPPAHCKLSENFIAPQYTPLWGGGGLLFFRIHVKGVIEYFCDAGGGAGHFV